MSYLHNFMNKLNIARYLLSIQYILHNKDYDMKKMHMLKIAD